MSSSTPSETSIANAALILLGERRIDSLEDESKTAKLLKERFSEVRDDTLRAYPWSFATKRIELQPTVTAPVWKYDFAYALPGDCLRVIQIYNPTDDEYRIEGRQIVTNIAGPLQLEYTSRETDPSQMDVLFRNAFAAALALDVAEAITGTSSKVEQLRAAFKEKVRAARTPDSQEPSVRVIEASDWLDSRSEQGYQRRIPTGNGYPL